MEIASEKGSAKACVLGFCSVDSWKEGADELPQVCFSLRDMGWACQRYQHRVDCADVWEHFLLGCGCVTSILQLVLSQNRRARSDRPAALRYRFSVQRLGPRRLVLHLLGP